jgi:hypothetical protein
LPSCSWLFGFGDAADRLGTAGKVYRRRQHHMQASHPCAIACTARSISPQKKRFRANWACIAAQRIASLRETGHQRPESIDFVIFSFLLWQVKNHKKQRRILFF